MESIAVRARLEALGILEPLWEEGWGGSFRQVYVASQERINGVLGPALTQQLDQTVTKLEGLEARYYAQLKTLDTGLEEYETLFKLRQELRATKTSLNQQVEALKESAISSAEGKELIKSFDGTMTSMNYQFSKNLTVSDRANLLLDRLIEVTRLQNANANIRSFANYFTSTGELSQKGVSYLNQFFGSSENLGPTEKSILKFVALSFPEEAHESVLGQLRQKKNEVYALFDPDAYPPRTAKAGEAFGDKLAELLFGKWEEISNPSKKWWSKLGGRLGSKIRYGSGIYFNGSRTHKFLKGQLVSYSKWEGFAEEVIKATQSRYNVTITKADVWQHWAKLDPDGRAAGTYRKIGGKVGDLIAEKYLSVLPGEMQDLVKGHLHQQLRDVLGDAASYKTKTVTGVRIDINNPGAYADDLISYRGVARAIWLTETGSSESKLGALNDVNLRLRYFRKALSDGHILTAMILLDNLIGSQVERLSEDQLSCEALSLLSSRYLAHQKRLADLGFIRN
ncbi:MAG: hypothetical protein HRU09_17310 [Oligoflexales bacterium]|nr:hypothetical protein [Oligoflexales bacterium]